MGAGGFAALGEESRMRGVRIVAELYVAVIRNGAPSTLDREEGNLNE